ncbi:MAG TPA: ABC transporter ATP-binding protein [Candidatus Cybelea sp.]|nr:ABC transporter ATP-binding protein [Candidatus Cybelea sp.]
MALLEVRNISKTFRGLRAVAEVSFDVPEGGIVALIGPNGAGKTTCFNMIAGSFRPDGGTVTLAGRRIDGLRQDQICHAGIGRTFQIVRPFAQLTVEENVIVGALNATGSVSVARGEARRALDMVGLGPKAGQMAASLTLPERKRLEIARAMATHPRILLLDEVMAGLRPLETDQMVQVFRTLNRETDLTILLIEHVMRAVMALAGHVIVLNHGETICAGPPEQVVRDPAVLECYLGEEAL